MINKRIYSFMSRVALIVALLLTTLNLPPVDTASALEADINLSPFYNVTDPALPGKLLEALNERTVPTTDGSLRDHAPVIVVAHRGVVDKDHPENTIQAAVNTMNAGIEALELDVFETADKVPYLMHDNTLKRMLGPAHTQYSDIYRWAKLSGDESLKTPTWAEIQNVPICGNNVDGYGMTKEQPVCNDINIYPATLDDTLHELYDNSYQGFISLDLREPQNVRDVATQMMRHYETDDTFGTWVINHVVLKFAPTLFNGVGDYFSQVQNHYEQLYGGTLPDSHLALLYVLPVYISNIVADKDGSGSSPWAINDYDSWVNWYKDRAPGENVFPPEVNLKATEAILNYGSDDLFTKTWKSGKSVGLYVPKPHCTFTPSADIPEPPNYLGDDFGTWWEGGVCGPLAPTMLDKECGNSDLGLIELSGGGCTDHRPYEQFWHDTAKFGFITTDTPVQDINYLAEFPGQRPNEQFKSVRLGTAPFIKVAADGSGNYTTIGAALNALPTAGGTIEVSPGTYNEKLLISKPNVTLVGTGTDASKVKITHNDYAAKTNPATGQPYGTTGSATVTVTGKDFYATNLTIQNTADYEAPNYEANAQAVALLTKGDRAVYRAVMVLGGQDTLYVHNNKRAYFNNCYVEGFVDFIFGNGKAVFDNTTIKSKVHTDLRGQVTITAQNRASASEDSGFVFNNNTLLFDDQYMDNVWLGRPWGSHSTVYWLNTKMGQQVTTPGWIEFVPAQYATPQIPATNNLPTSTYREYKTLYPNGSGGWTAFDISKRESTSPNSNVPLTDAQAASLAADTYLKGADNWKPTAVTYGTHTVQALPIPTLPVGAPGAPTIYSVTAGNKNLQVSWGGKPSNPQTTGYRIWAMQNGVKYGPVTVPPYVTSGFVGGLTNGVPAQIYVAAVNAQGVGTAAVSASVTPVSDAPAAPSSISFQKNSSSVTVIFNIADQGSQPVFGSGAVEHAGAYTALYASEKDAYAGNSIAGTSTGFITNQHTFTNLKPNTTYWVSLYAYNGKNSPTVITSFTTGSF